ncbi:2-amino-3-ketobutyrate coenzyme A ligase, mitochondrial [Zancudomyces culisetae]|uniref:2-amino-3-ketobutyrate coenzyme A ligase, mitochondrial n=1 Tax=Zancudomyces culisetae TaxID=1213189 RepID=A0A1R1PDX9_ZANCU|nr:2-amino-3-ketobutyrate coenzyme A ligase, mitochondrial [Zancudomyces culisetae]OMH80747.1 2-amino-3-ketobutyrate coenzyme A ligase, mitochondrial [Zancudomyces culisetae]|eukprot:OMH79129.1 2-amino-3-ketobutyrate coenzyme A ligase, mitochondrial [Zancudomyces culisetae]
MLVGPQTSNRAIRRVLLANTSKKLALRTYATLPQSYKQRLENEIKKMQDAGTYKSERIIGSSQSAAIKVIDKATGKTTEVLNLCANNYLGLSNDPYVEEKAIEYTKHFGNGLSSVRFICGTQSIHKDLEEKISQFYEKEDAILYSSCFDANAGIFEALLTPNDAIVSDELNHASIIDGIRLCKAARFRYKNCDMADLEQQIVKAKETTKDKNGVVMIATDGVFSMDGKIAKLDKICQLAEKYECLVFVDDCHATGVIGNSGKGSGEYFGVADKIHFVNSTFGKALGGASGGYTVGDKTSIDILRNRSRPYLFSNTLAPSVVGGAVAAFELLQNKDNGPMLLQRLKKNTEFFRSKMSAAGFNIIGDDHPIVPVMLGDARLASAFSEEMLKLGIYVIGFSYPVVPQGKARIRVQISAAHSIEQLEDVCKAFESIGKKLGVIS